MRRSYTFLDFNNFSFDLIACSQLHGTPLMICRTAEAMRIAPFFRTDLRKRIPKNEDALTARQGNSIADKEGRIHTWANAKLCPLWVKSGHRQPNRAPRRRG